MTEIHMYHLILILFPLDQLQLEGPMTDLLYKAMLLAKLSSLSTVALQRLKH